MKFELSEDSLKILLNTEFCCNNENISKLNNIMESLKNKLPSLLNKSSPNNDYHISSEIQQKLKYDKVFFIINNNFVDFENNNLSNEMVFYDLVPINSNPMNNSISFNDKFYIKLDDLFLNFINGRFFFSQNKQEFFFESLYFFQKKFIFFLPDFFLLLFF